MSILAQNNERSAVELESSREKMSQEEIPIPSKMHAAVVEQFEKPLSLVELNIPSPGPGEILVKTEACEVCHTDLMRCTATGQ